MKTRIPLLERVGLHRADLRAWALYDWANSAFMTTVIATVFPIYFQNVAAAGLEPATATARFSAASVIALTVGGIVSPLLGAVADYAGIRKHLLGAFMLLGATATGFMYFIHQGDWQLALLLFAVANIGISVSFVFYDSLLPHLAGADEIDRVSTAGYALGYLGGGTLLAINLLWIERPEAFGLAGPEHASRLAFASVALWWIVFSIPLFRRVAEPPRLLEDDERPGMSPVRVAVMRLGETLRELRQYRHAFVMLLAFLIYNDGITTIIRMAAIYGAELGFPQSDLITAILLVQFMGIPFAFLFGAAARRIGPRPAIFIGLGVYLSISVFAYFMTTVTHFYLLALLVGMVQGGTQALSRSLFASLIPRHKASEFFGFYGVFDRFGGIGGMTLFTILVTLTGSSRQAILSVATFFVIGAVLLARVGVDEGRRTARLAEQRARPVA
jgi:MFS transporter, UMF1 family